MSIEELDEKVVPIIEEISKDANVQTQKVQGSNQVIFKSATLDVSQREELNSRLEEEFGVDPEKITAETISSTISSEMRTGAVSAVVVSTVLMLLYVWFRFKDVRFGASSVAALVHDVLVVLAFYAAARVSVGNTFIACMLTIVGYSINATIVIFDRIRENMTSYKTKEELAAIVNRSISPDTVQKYFHIPDDLYYGCSAVHPGRVQYQRVCTAPDGRHSMRYLFLHLPGERVLVSAAHQSRRKESREE